MTDEPAVEDYMVLPMWTIYDHPMDFPQEFVARRHDVTRQGPVPTDDVVTGGTLEEVRAQIPPGLFCTPRSESDDSVIVETWF